MRQLPRQTGKACHVRFLCMPLKYGKNLAGAEIAAKAIAVTSTMKFVNTSVWCLEVWSCIDRKQRASMLRVGFGGMCRRCSEDKLTGYSFRTSMLPDLVLKHERHSNTAHIKMGITEIN